MKKLMLITIVMFQFVAVHSQDIIIKKSGDEIQSKVIEVGTSEIKYKKFENQDGPTYAIHKNEVFKIKYENGFEDVINAIEEKQAKEAKVENETATEPSPVQKSEPMTPPSKAGGYLERVREAQAKDPGISIYLGNGWLSRQGALSPLFGVDFRFPRNNVFLRGISLGARAGFTGLGTAIEDRQSYRQIYGFGLSIKYFAPIPIKQIQPYVVAIVGGALYNDYIGTEQVMYSSGLGWSHDVSSGGMAYTGFGVGCNFMFIRNIGFFVEGGYFTTSLINTGLVFKMGGIVK